MLDIMFKNTELMVYLLAAEGILLCILQLRTNRLLKKMLKARAQKKETVKQLKEEVKNGESKIPVIKFEKAKENAGEKTKAASKTDMNAKELAVLQEMMTEFFG